MKTKKIFPLLFILTISACQAPLSTIPNRKQETHKLTLGDVQKHIEKGSSSGKVIDVLGSPNIVTTNADGTESWVYDRIATEAEYAGGWLSAVSTKSTRTMIVVVKFDKSKTVEDVKYRQTNY